MIPVQLAVDNAVGFAQGVLGPARTGTMLLEEVEPDTFDGKQAWKITLSLPDPDLPLTIGANRQYKTFTVDGVTGEVLSMKIRELSSAT
jgi:hypothetical protein